MLHQDVWPVCIPCNMDRNKQNSLEQLNETFNYFKTISQCSDWTYIESMACKKIILFSMHFRKPKHCADHTVVWLQLDELYYIWTKKLHRMIDLWRENTFKNKRLSTHCFDLDECWTIFLIEFEENYFGTIQSWSRNLKKRTILNRSEAYLSMKFSHHRLEREKGERAKKMTGRMHSSILHHN